MAAHEMIGMMQSGMMGDGMMGGGMLIGWLVPLLALTGLTVLVVWAVRQLTGDRQSRNAEADALATARRRYARGEIDREEFRTLRSDLETA